MFSRRGFALFASLAAVCLLLSGQVFADSQARIVRLSYIEGDVQIDRNVGQGFEPAVLNMPVVQGTRLYTGNDGRVEVEFEDGSTLRLSGASDLMFRQLTLRTSGDKVSMVDLREGLAYFNIHHKGDDQFRIVVGSREFDIRKSADFRLRVEGNNVDLAVSKGEVRYDADGRDLAVKKNESVALDLNDPGRYFLAKNYDEYPSDQWNSERDQYRDQYDEAQNYNNYGPYAWGRSDLNYYGNYFDVPGYGWMWRPYGVGYDWDPFSYGAWSWYPGFGWTYVSAYPWGWTPYRYGSWMYLNNYGWAWRPSTAWRSWNTVPVVAHAPRNYVIPRAPVSGRGTIVTGLDDPSRPSPRLERPAPPGGVPAPIAGARRPITIIDRDRTVQGRPSAARPTGGEAGSGAITARRPGTGRQPMEVQRPGSQNQIPAESIRVSPTDMQPPDTERRVEGESSVSKSPEPRVRDSGRDVNEGRSSVFDRPRDEDAGRGAATRNIPSPQDERGAQQREAPRSSAPVTSTSEPRSSGPVSVTPSPAPRAVERPTPAPSAPRAAPAPSAPAPRAASPSMSSPRMSMPSAPRSMPAPRGASSRH